MSTYGDVLRPMFVERGDHYLMSLAGVLLIAGGALYGDPKETTRKGRANAEKMIDLIIGAAVRHLFPRQAELRQLLRENIPCERLRELASEATALIPNEVTAQLLKSIKG